MYIKATPQKVWDAITDPEWNSRYAFKAASNYELRPGGAYRVVSTPEMQSIGAPETLIDGEVLEVDPPHRLVQTWHAYFTPDTASEVQRVAVMLGVGNTVDRRDFAVVGLVHAVPAIAQLERLAHVVSRDVIAARGADGLGCGRDRSLRVKRDCDSSTIKSTGRHTNFRSALRMSAPGRRWASVKI